jgi:hypothetical protein
MVIVYQLFFVQKANPLSLKWDFFLNIESFHFV